MTTEFIGRDGGGALQRRGGVTTGVTETAMPDFSGGNGGLKGEGGGWRDGVEVTRAIAAKDHGLRPEVLHRETKGVKLNSTRMITSEFAKR